MSVSKSLLLLTFVWISGIILPVIKGSPHSLGVLFVYSNSPRYNSTEALDSVQKAIDDGDVLPGYKLEITAAIDAKCNSSIAVQETLKYITNPISSQPLIAIIGGGCSPATDALIDIAEYQNIPLISYSSTSTLPQASNYYQLYPSDAAVIKSLVTAIKYYGWNRISIITEAERQFMEMEHQLIQSLASENIFVNGTPHIWPHENISNNVQLFRTDARIFFLNTFENTARKILCEAYSRGIYYPDYGWLLHGWYNEDWLLSDPNVHCTTQQLSKVVERGIVIQQYTEEDERSSISSYGYDAVWSLVLALNSTLNMINDNTVNETNCIGPFTPLYNRTTGTDCLLRYNLLNTEFRGKSGVVVLNDHGVREVGAVYLLQYREESSVLIKYARVNVTANEPSIVYISNESNTTVWPDGIPPDGSPIEVLSQYPIFLVVFMYLWASVGIIFTLICLVFTIVFRNRKIIRLTSPNLNYFIIAGALTLYISTYFIVAPVDSYILETFTCYATVWMISFGITLIFAPILAKMLRIYQIFLKPTSRKKVMTDKHLFFIVLAILGFLLLLLVLGSAIPYTRPVVTYSLDLENPSMENEKGIIVENYGVNCYTNASFVWIIIIAIFIGTLETVAVVLAVKTRQVKVEAVNDSKEVVAIVYIVTACSVVIIVVAYFLQNYSSLCEGFYLTGVLVGTTSAIALAFVSKMWSLYKDPKGENVFEDKTLRSDSFRQSQIHRQDSQRIETLEKEVGTLKQRLNSLRLTSVPEELEINKKPMSNGYGHRNRLASDDVFSPPTTPVSTEAKLSIADTV